LVVVAAFALCFWLYHKLFPNDVDLIRRQLVEMAEDASFESNEGQIAKATKSGALAGHFTINAEISVKPWGFGQIFVSGRTEIRQTSMGVRSAIASLRVTVDRIDIRVAEDRESAEADVSLTALSSRQDEPWSETVDIQLKRVDGDWLISRITNRPILRQ